MTNQTTTSNPPGPNGHVFKDAKDVERYYVHAAKKGDWEWVREIREDAQNLFAADIARIDRKLGCDDYVIAIMLRPTQERLFDDTQLSLPGPVADGDGVRPDAGAVAEG